MGTRPLQRALLLAMLLVTGSGTSLPAAAGELKPFTATYAISRGGLQGGTHEIQLEKLSDGRWSYRSRTTASLLARMATFGKVPANLVSRSVFRIQNDQVIPESFTAEDGTDSVAKDQDITFDWTAGRVHGVAERKKVDLPTQSGLLDELSVQVALMHALVAGRTPDSFVLLDGDHIKNYLYSAQGKDRLKTDVGEYDTVIFRSSRSGSTKETWFWCAPELGYMPLKVERRDGNDVQFTMRVQHLTR